MTEQEPKELGFIEKLALSAYLWERCRYYNHKFQTVQELLDRDVVYAGYSELGRIACRVCWKAQDQGGKND